MSLPLDPSSLGSPPVFSGLSFGLLRSFLVALSQTNSFSSLLWRLTCLLVFCPQAFVATGTNLSLQFFPAHQHSDQRQVPTREYVDFERETGKVRHQR